MVDDILLTAEEQDERAKQWFKENGLALIVGIVLGLGALLGYNHYQAKLKSDAEQASVLYDIVLDLVKQSDLSDIDTQVRTLKNDFSGTSYAAKAVLLRARQLSVNDLDAAFAELGWVRDNSDELGLQHTARIRQVKILIAQDKLDAAKAMAGELPYQGFDSFYNELLGDVAALQNEFKLAHDHYQAALDNIGSRDTSYLSIINLKKNRLPLAETSLVETSLAETPATLNDVNTATANNIKAEVESIETQPDNQAEIGEAETVDDSGDNSDVE